MNINFSYTMNINFLNHDKSLLARQKMHLNKWDFGSMGTILCFIEAFIHKCLPFANVKSKQWKQYILVHKGVLHSLFHTFMFIKQMKGKIQMPFFISVTVIPLVFYVDNFNKRYLNLYNYSLLLIWLSHNCVRI